MEIVAHLDIREALEAAGLASDIQRFVGEMVYQLAWIDPEAGTRREGFCSAVSASAAKRLVIAHEGGYGRSVEALTARQWGQRADLADWAASRAACQG